MFLGTSPNIMVVKFVYRWHPFNFLGLVTQKIIYLSSHIIPKQTPQKKKLGLLTFNLTIGRNTVEPAWAY